MGRARKEASGLREAVKRGALAFESQALRHTEEKS
jgi:hypothetical protein